MEKVWNIGVGNGISMYLRGKIRISNFIALVLFLLGGIYALISAYAGSPLFILPVGALLFACSVFFLNYFERNKLARLVLSVSAVSCCSVYHAGIINQPGHVNSALYFAEFGFALFPWILFDFRERLLLLATAYFGVVVIGVQPFLNGWLQLTQETEYFDQFFFYVVTYVFASLIIFLCIGSLIYNNEKKESELSSSRLYAEQTLEQLKQSQEKLVREEKMSAIGVLTSGVAHEVNNPLNFILGGYEGLKEIVKENRLDDENTLFWMDCIQSGVKRISNIVKGLNQFNAKKEIADKACNIHSIIDNCLDVLQYTYSGRIKIVKEYCAEKTVINGNAGNLHQVFLNVLLNAIDSIPQEGEIKIHTSLNEKYVSVLIVDNGCGLPEGDVNRVIEPFFTTKMTGGRLGLGLSISYAIVEEHQGRLRFSSKENQGTFVTLEFPL